MSIAENIAAIRAKMDAAALASPFGRGAPVRTLGRRGPSQSKIGYEVPIFASSPRGGAK